MTPRQSWALFCATKIDVRNLPISVERASELLDNANNGGLESVCNELLAMGGKQKGRATPRKDWATLYDRAHNAGMKALEDCTPKPMIVQGYESTPVEGGVCGFAWVNIRPATTSFARWMKKQGHARKAYYGGLDMWVSVGGQSMARKEAYARAFAEVLQGEGIKAYAQSRMD